MVTQIDFIQDNLYAGSDLLPVHSPLVFIVEVTYTGATPDSLAAIIKDKDEITLETLSCIPYKDSSGKRQFVLFADKILKSYMPELKDFTQSSNSLIFCDYLTTQFTIEFAQDDGIASTTFNAINAARQIAQRPNCNDLFNNESQTFVGAEDEPVYVYFYNDNITNNLTISVT